MPPWDESSIKRGHPFYGCVTGQALFYLLQEHELPEARIQALLDEFEAGKTTLAALLNSRPAAVRLRVACQESATCAACRACAALDGVMIPGDHPELIALLPPYGLGCLATAEALDLPASASSPLPPIPRPHPLCCALVLTPTP